VIGFHNEVFHYSKHCGLGKQSIEIKRKNFYVGVRDEIKDLPTDNHKPISIDSAGLEERLKCFLLRSIQCVLSRCSLY